MGCTNLQMLSRAVWALARRQHGVLARRQLLELGTSRSWIEHRIAKGRLHPVHRGVYAVGRPELTREGRWMAAVLACGPHAFLSHESAGLLWRILPEHRRRFAPAHPIHISLDAAVFRQLPGIQVHRTATFISADLTTHRNIPVTSPTRTLLDLATTLPTKALESAVNEADALDLIDPETIRAAIEARKCQPGVRPLRTLLDRHTFRLTESELSGASCASSGAPAFRFRTLRSSSAGESISTGPSSGSLSRPTACATHRTPARQANDNRRMQAHAAAGRTAIRISHYEIRFESARVGAVLADLIRRREDA